MITFLRRICGKSAYPDPSLNLTSSEFEVDKWIISQFVIKELLPIVGFRPYPLDELMMMVGAVTRLRPTHIFEWGTHLGKSARIFHETSAKFRIDSIIHSIDLPDDAEHGEHPHAQRGKYAKNLKNVHLHQGDGLEVALDIYRSLPDNCNPLFYLDGDHSYHSVRRELLEILANVTGANVLLHDSFFQSPDSGYNVGPFMALHDVLSAIPVQYSTMSTNAGLPGMTLLYRLQRMK